MDIYEFTNLLSDDSVTIAIYDYTTEKEVFVGEARDATDKFSYSEIVGIDVLRPNDDRRGITCILNIETDEDGEEESCEDEDEDGVEWYDIGEDHWRVDMVSAGGVKECLATFRTEEEALCFCDNNNWRWVDENEFEWSLEVNDL